jgi:hypothetical protein
MFRLAIALFASALSIALVRAREWTFGVVGGHGAESGAILALGTLANIPVEHALGGLSSVFLPSFAAAGVIVFIYYFALHATSKGCADTPAIHPSNGTIPSLMRMTLAQVARATAMWLGEGDI